MVNILFTLAYKKIAIRRRYRLYLYQEQGGNLAVFCKLVLRQLSLLQYNFDMYVFVVTAAGEEENLLRLLCGQHQNVRLQQLYKSKLLLREMQRLSLTW